MTATHIHTFEEREVRAIQQILKNCKLIGDIETKQFLINMKVEVLTVLKMSFLVFWAVTSCGLTCGYQHCKETYCLHLQV
jgi:hypothetical protein